MRTGSGFWAGVILALGLATGEAQRERPAPALNEIYRQHCAVCHGEKMDSGLGGSLIDGKWNHGESDEAITRAIADGLPDFGMQGFAEILTPEEIRGLVILIRENEAREKARRSQFPEASTEAPAKTRYHNYSVETLAEGFEIPWAIAFLPDGRFLVTERPGRVRIMEANGRVGPPVENIPASVHHGQGGMMEVALHPDFEKNGWIYLGFSDGTKEGKQANVLTKIVRGRIKDNRWQDEEVIWQGKPSAYGGSGAHFGTRLVFRDGYLWFAIGDRGQQNLAQDLSVPNGAIFRLHDDGRIPEDNPFVGRKDALPEIWSYGHRNPQGLVIDPRNGDIYNTEHGPRGGDEFNLVLPGRNYGWPVITHGMNYNGTPITAETAKEGMEQPILQWTPSIAACGLDVGRGEQFPLWQNDFFAGGLASQEVRRLRVVDRAVVEEEIVVKGLGRVRDVRFGPDGLLYLVLNGPDRIVRLRPEK